ncbi:hypothetical protein ELR70_21715 [Pseudoalteromonas sp. R3]|nr:hypothetical protein ELR70_21715 [Pseudoalteromonas sp. R3]
MSKNARFVQLVSERTVFLTFLQKRGCAGFRFPYNAHPPTRGTPLKSNEPSERESQTESLIKKN